VSQNRKLIAVAASGIVALIVVVLAITLGGGSSKKDTTTTSPAAAAAAAPAAFLKGVPQSGDTLGNATAPATVYVYEDPQCPYCSDWSLTVLPSVVKGFVKPGKVKLAWRGIAIVGDNSVAGLKAAYAAGEQNKLWTFVDQLYQRQGSENTGWITDSVLRDAAAVAGVDPNKMMSAADSASVQADLEKSAKQASQDGVGGTPTFVVVKPHAQRTMLKLSALTPAAFSSALTAALQ
jgi:protein-disulfide isomerase